MIGARKHGSTWTVQILTKDYSELKEVGEFLQAKSEAYVVLSGYTDNVGSVEYNLELARRRAENAASYLVDQVGIALDRIVVQWYGLANPVATNDTEQGRALNRRVELAVGGL